MTQNATDFENQVVNLVKAAMSGDEEANDVIVQIIEAAKKGDEQALKVVALIKQLTQSNSDQAEEGAEENTEAMKCGGKVRAKMKANKSAEKKEEGGEIPEEKCGGTAKKMRKAVCKAKKCKEGDKLTDTQKFLLGAKCGAKMKKPKKCESGDHIEELEDYLAVKCGGKMKKTKKHEEGGQISLDFSQIDFAKCGKKLKKKEDGGEIAEEKCGGKAKKVKKGEVGVRLPEGAHGQIRSKSISAVFAKGGNTCPCALKRIGGKIVNVDSCTGLPIHKNGGNFFFQLGGQIGWHNRRYSKDEIKRIQAALNRQALDKQIAVDGIMGKETIAAIQAFQRQHANELKVDGLAGDKTLSALGVSGIGDSRLPETRAGQNQARRTVNESAAEAQKRAYYNSDEVWNWLRNASNAHGEYKDRYIQMAKEALKYISPERASRLRYIANLDPDEYDEDTHNQHEYAKLREYGLNMFKDAMSKGIIRTAKDYDNWMNKYHLSKEEMAELMADPATIEAQQVAATLADNGRTNSQKAQADRVQQDITNHLNEVGTNYVLPAMSLAGGLVTAPISLTGALAGGYATDKATQILSGGQYDTWGQFMGDATGTQDQTWAWEFTNPGALVGGFAGSRYTPKVNPVKVKVRIPNPNAGQPYTTRARGKYVVSGVEPVKPVTMGDVRGATRPVYQYVPGQSRQAIQGKYKTKTFTISGAPAEFDPQFYAPLRNTSVNSPVLGSYNLEVPEFNPYETTYGPYLGTNRNQQPQPTMLPEIEVVANRINK